MCSTGGIIALGLGPRNWSLEKGTKEFTTLSKQAFTSYMGSNLPMIGKLNEAIHQGQYNVKQLENALQTAFKDNVLFGGRRKATLGLQPKTAVTGTTLSGRPVVLANYNRESPRARMYSKTTAYARFDTH